VIFTVPAVAPTTPVTTPVVDTTVARAVLLLLHVPPVTVLLSVTELPVHTATLAGVIAAGEVLTVTPFIIKQPVAEIVYVMLAVPGATPVTNPPALTVAIAALLLLHVPPGVVLVNVAVLPTQRMVGGIGLITLGSGLTVTTAVEVHPVPNE
jgi:hypothetical protein